MADHVPRDERHVRARNDDDGDRNADEREQLIVHGPLPARSVTRVLDLTILPFASGA
jgi:hypothetical protein